MGVALVSLEVKKYDQIVQLPATVEEGTLHALCKLDSRAPEIRGNPSLKTENFFYYYSFAMGI